MSSISRSAIAAVLVLFAGSALAADLNCAASSRSEEFRYSWRLKGGARFIAGLVFPTRGVGNLKTTFPSGAEGAVRSELLITAPNGRAGGFYSYESDIDARRARTMVTSHGYSWGNKARNDRTVIDYGKGLARMERTRPDQVENRVKKLPEGNQDLRDVLTAIYFLRHNAHRISAPLQTNIYSEGKEYPVLFRPIAEKKSFVLGGTSITARGFEIVDAPGGKKWPGGVKVWVSEDDRRIPLRIEINQSLATLQLDLSSVESCSLMARL
jgi:hypothetical protein